MKRTSDFRRQVIHILTPGALILDRFEGDWAVVECGGVLFNLPRSLLPQEAAEGDVLRIAVEVDAVRTAERRERIRTLEAEAFK